METADPAVAATVAVEGEKKSKEAVAGAEEKGGKGEGGGKTSRPGKRPAEGPPARESETRSAGGHGAGGSAASAGKGPGSSPAAEEESKESAEPASKMRRIKLGGYDFFKSIGSPKFIVAPMVNQSEAPFRMLTREYGAELCFTPMIHAKLFATQPKQREGYRKKCIGAFKNEGPLFVQFCGNDPELMLAAAKLVEDECDAVDINLGCPQGIARKGHYGSFLLEETDLLVSMVSTLHNNLAIPVTCKIRVLPTMEETMKLCHALEGAGCQMLTVHGRTREMKKHLTGPCDWDAIKQIKEALSIPVIANGGVGCLADIKRCMEYTGADGVMTSEAVLENPAIFVDRIHPKTGVRLSQIDIARRYMDYVEMEEEVNLKPVRPHLFKLLYVFFKDHPSYREPLCQRQISVPIIRKMLDDIEAGLPALVEETRTMGVDDAPKVEPTIEDDTPLGIKLGGAAKGGRWYMRHLTDKAVIEHKAQVDAKAAAARSVDEGEAAPGVPPAPRAGAGGEPSATVTVAP